MFKFGYRKVGGPRFVHIGRLFFSFGLSRTYRPLGVANA